jgi:uncharacterized membrane protein
MPDKPRRPMSTDQRRALLVLAFITGLVGIVVIGIALLAASLGLPVWVAVVLAITLAAAIGLFMLLNLA